MPYKRLSGFSKTFSIPQFLAVSRKMDFFNSHRRLHSLRPHECNGSVTPTMHSNPVPHSHSLIAALAQLWLAQGQLFRHALPAAIAQDPGIGKTLVTMADAPVFGLQGNVVEPDGYHRVGSYGMGRKKRHLNV